MDRLDKKLAHKATQEDQAVINKAHPLGYRILKLIAKKGDVVRVPKIGVVVSDAAILRNILLSPDSFSKVGKGVSSDLWTPIIGSNGLLNMDGKEHAHLRKQLSPLFTSRFVNSIVEETLAPHMDSLKTRLLNGEKVDIAFEAEESAALVICKLTGFDVNSENHEEINNRLGEARSLTSMAKLTKPKLSPAQIALAKEKLAFINVSTRAAYNSGDMSTVPARLKEEGLSEEDTVSVVSAMIIAGTETIISFIPRMVALFVTTDYFVHLKDNPDDISSGINEAMRVIVPTPVMLRSVKVDSRIGNLEVLKGERLVLSTILSCRKAGDFNPFQPIPKEMRQLWFGAGVHFCIGMPLALAQAQLFTKTLIEVYETKSRLNIIHKTVRTNTLAPAYKELILKCEQS